MKCIAMDEIIRKLELIKGARLGIVPLAEVYSCHEKSDAKRLCSNPTVSVVMMTYNHEDFLQQAIDGVVSQLADFKFELILCEDCSTDKTREICFKNQERYPEIIRVLWAEKNIGKLGGNRLRGEHFARGEFIAYCEGDDYWTYPGKLADQVELMRRTPSAGICYAGTDYMLDSTKEVVVSYESRYMPKERLRGEEACRKVIFGAALRLGMYGPGRHFSTCVLRKKLLDEQKIRYPEVFGINWMFGDTLILAMIAARSDVCFLDKCASVYRLNNGGITRRNPTELMINVHLFNIYLSTRLFDLSFEEAYDLFSDKFVWTLYVGVLKRTDNEREDIVSRIKNEPLVNRLFLRWHCRMLFNTLVSGGFNGFNFAIAKGVYKIGASLRKRWNRRKYYERQFR